MIAAGIAASGLPVAVPKNARCASACFLIFAAAKVKVASHSAQIGVHSVLDGTSGLETADAKATTTELARACAARGVPPSIVGRMVTTPPGRIAWLSERELLSMGVRMVQHELNQ